MSRSKTIKLQDLKNFSNVLEPTKPHIIKWHDFFGNSHPLILELACGKGDHSLAMAKANPKINFIAIDIKGARLWHGAKYALENNIKNLAFLRINIVDLNQYFQPNSIAEIWITFPDPFPKTKQAKHRLTAPQFLDTYQLLLKSGGCIHLKTDDLYLFNYSVEAATQKNWQTKEIVNNIYALGLNKHQQKMLQNVINIQTAYEKQHLKNGKQINYCKFQINNK